MTPPQGPQPWAKAGIIIKASTTPGSAYAAVMATPGHGVRMQWNYTNDTAGLPGTVSAASPRWLRLTRSGDTITGYDSADGSHWTKIGTATLAGLPSTVQAGLFVASPQYVAASQVRQQQLLPVRHAGDRRLRPRQPVRRAARRYLERGRGRRLVRCGRSGQRERQGLPAAAAARQYLRWEARAAAGGLTRSGGTFRVRAYGGDIAPYVTNVDPLGTVFKGPPSG